MLAFAPERTKLGLDIDSRLARGQYTVRIERAFDLLIDGALGWTIKIRSLVHESGIDAIDGIASFAEFGQQCQHRDKSGPGTGLKWGQLG